VRRILTQAAQAAVQKKGCHFQTVFRRLSPQLGYKGAIWAIAHRLGRLLWKILHDGVAYVEQGTETNPAARKRRAQKLANALRKLGYQVTLTPPNTFTGYQPGGVIFNRAVRQGAARCQWQSGWEQPVRW